MYMILRLFLDPVSQHIVVYIQKSIHDWWYTGRANDAKALIDIQPVSGNSNQPAIWDDINDDNSIGHLQHM